MLKLSSLLPLSEQPSLDVNKSQLFNTLFSDSNMNFSYENLPHNLTHRPLHNPPSKAVGGDDDGGARKHKDEKGANNINNDNSNNDCNNNNNKNDKINTNNNNDGNSNNNNRYNIHTPIVINDREQLRVKEAMKRFVKIGMLVQFESLLSCYGDEMHMLEDEMSGVDELSRVRFKLVPKVEKAFGMKKKSNALPSRVIGHLIFDTSSKSSSLKTSVSEFPSEELVDVASLQPDSEQGSSESYDDDDDGIDNDSSTTASSIQADKQETLISSNKSLNDGLLLKTLSSKVAFLFHPIPSHPIPSHLISFHLILFHPISPHPSSSYLHYSNLI